MGGLLLLAVAVDNRVIVVTKADDRTLERLVSASNNCPTPAARSRLKSAREQHPLELDFVDLGSHSLQQYRVV